MPSTVKILPVFTTEQQYGRCEPLRLTDKWEDDYGSGDRYNSDYGNARRAFLNSYRFTGENDGFKERIKRRLEEVKGATPDVMVAFKDKLKRSLKEVKDASVNVMAGLRRAIHGKRRPLAVGRGADHSHRQRISLGLPSRLNLAGGIDCLAPWWIKLQLKAAGRY